MTPCRRVTRLQLTQMMTAWSSDHYLHGRREFAIETSEDGRSVRVEVWDGCTSPQESGNKASDPGIIEKPTPL